MSQQSWNDQTQDGDVVRITSRFLTGEAHITHDELAAQWPGWSEFERHDFMMAYGACPDSTSLNHFEILRFLMAQASPVLMAGTGVLTRLAEFPDKNVTLEYLLGLLAAPDVSSANIYQAIGHLGDASALQTLLARQRVLLADPALHSTDGFINELACECISLSAAIHKLDPTPANLERLEAFTRHPHPMTAQHARAVLMQQGT